MDPFTIPDVCLEEVMSFVGWDDIRVDVRLQEVVYDARDAFPAFTHLRGVVWPQLVSKRWRTVRRNLRTRLRTVAPDSLWLEPERCGETVAEDLHGALSRVADERRRFRMAVETLLYGELREVEVVGATSDQHRCWTKCYSATGCSVVDLSRVLRNRRLEHLKVGVSEIQYIGDLKSLALAIADNGSLQRVDIALSTRDRKSKAFYLLLGGPKPKKKSANELCEAVIEHASDRLVASFERESFFLSWGAVETVVIRRRAKPALAALEDLLQDDADEVVDLPADLTLAYLFCPLVAKRVSEKHIGLTFSRKMTDATLRRLKKVPTLQKIKTLVFAGDETRAAKVFEAPLWRQHHLATLWNVKFDPIKPPPIDMSAMTTLRSLKITNRFLDRGLPPNLERYALHYSAGGRDICHWLDFSTCPNLRDLYIDGLFGRVRRLPPNANTVRLKYCQLDIANCCSGSSPLELLMLENLDKYDVQRLVDRSPLDLTALIHNTRARHLVIVAGFNELTVTIGSLTAFHNACSRHLQSLRLHFGWNFDANTSSDVPLTEIRTYFTDQKEWRSRPYPFSAVLREDATRSGTVFVEQERPPSPAEQKKLDTSLETVDLPPGIDCIVFPTNAETFRTHRNWRHTTCQNTIILDRILL